MLKSTKIINNLSLAEIQRQNEAYALANSTMNELRARLYNEGIKYPADATRKQLLKLIEKQGS